MPSYHCEDKTISGPSFHYDWHLYIERHVYWLMWNPGTSHKTKLWKRQGFPRSTSTAILKNSVGVFFVIGMNKLWTNRPVVGGLRSNGLLTNLPPLVAGKLSKSEAAMTNSGSYQNPKQPLRWRHNDHDSVSNHQPHSCLLNRLFGRWSKKTSKFRVTGLCVGNSPGPVNSPHKGPVTRKMFPFDDVIMDDEFVSLTAFPFQWWADPCKHMFDAHEANKKCLCVNCVIEIFGSITFEHLLKSFWIERIRI